MLPAPLQRKKQPPSPQKLASRKALGSLFSGLAVAFAIIGTALQVVAWGHQGENHEEMRLTTMVMLSFAVAPFAAYVAGSCWHSENITRATWGRSVAILLINVVCIAFLMQNLGLLWGALCPGPVLCLLIETSLQAGIKKDKKKSKPNYPRS
jgi:hypothetical protein